MADKKLGRGWLTVIGVFKLVKAAGLLAIGTFTLTLAQEEARHDLAHWEAIVSFAPGHKFLHALIAKVAGLEPRQLSEIGIATFVYACIFLVEGIGLLLQKRWAEYVTILVTLSFIPLEAYEIVERVTAVRIVALVVNVAVVVYLVVRVRTERKQETPASKAPPRGGLAQS